MTPTDFCAIAAPVWIGDGDVLTDETARQILRHNNRWEVLCGEEVPAVRSFLPQRKPPIPAGKAA
jgi:hypothetical protein